MAGESASFDDQDNASTSFIKNHEHGSKELSDEIAVMIESLQPLPNHRFTCCIYKVSDHIRQSNKEAYTPQVISIGPFHRNNPKLQKMEDFKLRYVKIFLERAERKLEDIVSTIKVVEGVRISYSETITLGSDDFVKMILVDAIFIIEFFWILKSGDTNGYLGLLDESLIKRMQMDLILLENQLPFFVIENIYDTAFPYHSKEDSIVDWLSLFLFKYYKSQELTIRDIDRNSVSGIFILHFTDLLRRFFLPPEGLLEISFQNIKEMHSVAQLDEVGLKFKKTESSNCSPLGLKYPEDGGLLEIPRFQLDKSTEIYARNLISFEQRYYPDDEAYITDYYFLLRSLIRSQRDVDLFVLEGILVDRVGVDAISVLNKILANIDPSEMPNHYSQLAEKLNLFYEARVTYFQKMMAILKREYFRNPWRGTATIGGIFLLLLTVIQTVCALISVMNWK